MSTNKLLSPNGMDISLVFSDTLLSFCGLPESSASSYKKKKIPHIQENYY